MGTSLPAAFARGMSYVDEAQTARRQRKDLLADEARHVAVNDLFAQRDSILKNLPDIKDNPAALKQAQDALTNLHTNIEQAYHPIHAPGALQRDWQWLSKLAGMQKKTPTVLEMPSQNITIPGTTQPSVKLGEWQSQYATQGPQVTTLSPQEETEFQDWVKANNIPSETASGTPDPTFAAPDNNYDMRGYWRAWKQGRVQQDPKSAHFPDTWKTKYHQSFSNESQYALPNAPKWNDKDQLVDASGNILFDENAKKTGAPVAGAPVTLATGPQTVKLSATPSFTPQERQAMAQREQAKAATALDLAGVGPSPAQVAETKARNDKITFDANIRNARQAYRDLGLPPEGEAGFISDVLKEQFGIKTPTSGSWKQVHGKLNGHDEDLLFSAGKYYWADGTPLSSEDSIAFHPDATKAVKKVRDGAPVPIGGGKFAQIWVDPYDPQNQTKWAWTPVGPGRYQQTIKSASTQTDPSGFVTKTLRVTGPDKQVYYDVSKIGQKPEDYSGDETEPVTTPVQAAPPAPAPAAPVARPSRPVAAPPAPSAGPAAQPASPAPAAAKPARPAASPAAPVATVLPPQNPNDPLITDPKAPKGTYNNPLPLDHGSIPDTDRPPFMTELEWNSIRAGAEGLLRGKLPKELGVKEGALPKVMAVARKYGWEQDLFTPKDKLLIAEATKFLVDTRSAPSLSVLANFSSREKIHNALMASEKGDFVPSQIAMVFGMNHQEQDFYQRYKQLRATVTGLSQLTRGGRTTEAGIRRLQSELPNPVDVHSAADARMYIDRLLEEVKIAQAQGFISESPPPDLPPPPPPSAGENRRDVINRVLQTH